MFIGLFSFYFVVFETVFTVYRIPSIQHNESLYTFLICVLNIAKFICAPTILIGSPSGKDTNFGFRNVNGKGEPYFNLVSIGK